MFHRNKDKEDKKKKALKKEDYSILIATPAPTPVATPTPAPTPAPTPRPTLEPPVRPSQEQQFSLEACFEAVTSGKLEYLKKHINEENVNKLRNNGGSTLLGIAATTEHDEVIKYLLRLKADVHARIVHQTPLHLAASNNKVRAMELLLNAGADINSKSLGYFNTPLHLALVNRDEAAVSLLISCGAEVNTRNSQHYTPLAILIINTGYETPSISRPNEESITRMFKLLIEKNANLDFKYPDIFDNGPALTLQEFAGKFKRFEILDMLTLTEKANRDASNTFLLSKIEKLQTTLDNLSTRVQSVEQRLAEASEVKKSHSPRFGFGPNN